MPSPSREKAPKERGPELRPVPDLSPEERAGQEADAARIHGHTEALRAKTAEYDARALARVQAEVERTKKRGVEQAQREVDAAAWEGSPHDTEPMMQAVSPETRISSTSRQTAEIKAMAEQAEERLREAGIDPDDLAAGKVGFFKRFGHGNLIKEWQEAVSARTEIESKARPFKADRRDIARMQRAAAEKPRTEKE